MRWLDLEHIRRPLNQVMSDLKARSRVIPVTECEQSLSRGEAMAEASAPRSAKCGSAGNNPPIDMSCHRVYDVSNGRCPMRTNILINEDAKAGFDNIPKRITMSGVVRLFGAAFLSFSKGESAAAFRKQRDNNSELKETADYIRENIAKYIL